MLEMLESLKTRSEHQRRFGGLAGSGLNPDGNFLCQIEGDIEEWLVEHGYWELDE